MAISWPGRVAIVGGGPAGLFLARMIGITNPRAQVDVYERNAPSDTFGFGVTLSDRTMRRVALHDAATHHRIIEASVHLTGVELRHPRATMRYDGFGAAAISRHTLLSLLREQAEEVGARVHFGREIGAVDFDADVVAFADGAASIQRAARQAQFGTTVYSGAARYVWLGVPVEFRDVITFSFAQTDYGPIAAHTYSYTAGMSTVVIEMEDATWTAAGFDRPSGVSLPDEIDRAALDCLSEIFADSFDGKGLISNRSRWARFNVVNNATWSAGNTVLLGDAAHTAHFTVGSGTKMALEDAIALATALRAFDQPAKAFAAYEKEQRVPIGRTQRWAEPSMRWWETWSRRSHLPPAQFGMHFITRTVALSYLGMRRRFADRVDDAEATYLRESGDPAATSRNAVATPLRLGPVHLPNRLVTVVPAMASGHHHSVHGRATPGPASADAAGRVRGGLVLIRDDATQALRDWAAQAWPASVFGAIRRLAIDWDSSHTNGVHTQDVHPAAADTNGVDLRGVSNAAAPPDSRRTSPPLWFAELACPDQPEWTEAADQLVRSAELLRKDGVAGILLRPNLSSPAWWYETLRHASRVRTEAALPVGVYIPAEWHFDLARDTTEDSWPARIHVALISGRIDLVAAIPMTRSELLRAG